MANAQPANQVLQPIYNVRLKPQVFPSKSSSMFNSCVAVGGLTLEECVAMVPEVSMHATAWPLVSEILEAEVSA